MYIRKQTLIIAGAVVVGFIVGNTILVVKEWKEGKKFTIHSIIDLLREGAQLF